jgi:anti-sigma B factor antagonist
VQLLPVSDRPSRTSQPSIGRLSINARRQDERHILFLKGEIDVASAPILEATMDELCAGGAEEIVLDLSGIEFVDSSGLGAILHGKTLCEKHGCAYSLTPAQRPVERMLDMTGVKGRLRFRPRTRGALRSDH